MTLENLWFHKIEVQNWWICSFFRLRNIYRVFPWVLDIHLDLIEKAEAQGVCQESQWCQLLGKFLVVLGLVWHLGRKRGVRTTLAYVGVLIYYFGQIQIQLGNVQIFNDK